LGTTGVDHHLLFIPLVGVLYIAAQANINFLKMFSFGLKPGPVTATKLKHINISDRYLPQVNASAALFN